MARNHWPGNVRELENAVERAVLLSQGPEVGAAELGPEVTGAGQARSREGTLPAAPLGPLREGLEGPERALIERALAATGGNRKRAAALLGINRTTLFNKMRKYELFERPGDRGPALR
jgi:DNA-binding NtrC family response regulator